MAHLAWPLYDLVIRTPRLELRLPNEDEIVELLAHSDERIYERTGFLPFHIDWPGNHVESIKYHWRSRVEWKPEKWHFGLSTFVDGRVVGAQGIEAENFATLRRVDTGSWLIPDAQGKGIGKEMRTAVLHFAFAGLGALEAHSEAHVDNAASNAVSAAMGYETTHREGSTFGDERHEVFNMILRRSNWEQLEVHQRDDIEIIGLDSVLDWFIAPS